MIGMRGIRVRLARREWRETRVRVRKVVRHALAAVAALSAVALVATGLRIHHFVTEAAPRPTLGPGPDILDTLIDRTPVRIRTTVGWQKVPQVVTMHALLHDPTVWRRMHFDDWDRLPRPLAERGMEAMIGRHAYALDGPARWAGMSTFDWDAVPQPVRAIAYLRMVWYWTELERVGEDFGWRPRDLAPTIAAIVMAESWFEHRAINENEWGNRDLGLAQCSDHCRQTLAELAGAGEVPFALEEAQYFNPWFATRVATVWFHRELRRADGDIELAIRAYHRGQAQALDRKGDVYLAGVLDKRARYILNVDAPASWQYLVQEVSERVR
jgi:hypothetical protein